VGDIMKKNEKLNVENLLKDLDKYEPRRRGWAWREAAPGIAMGPFVYREASAPLKNSVPLASAKCFNNIDPQPMPVIGAEIAAGRFEDDVRNMRMAAWHGADHIMAIRADGAPLARKQARLQRKALDYIEEEVGRPINYHSCVSGVVGPELAVMFAEEGMNGAHQDPLCDVLCRNSNLIRSVVDACEAKKIMAWAGMAQIDGAHNDGAREAWEAMPGLIARRAINALFSEKAGIPKSLICLSMAPPLAPPAPCVFVYLPYAVAQRDLFGEYRMRAQMNANHVEASDRENTAAHVLHILVSKLAGADIQSTIAPDEGGVPRHIHNMDACDTAKQALNGLDGLMEMIQLKDDGPLREKAREIKERACLFMEEIVEAGGYFKAAERGFFVDSCCYSERNGDGMVRTLDAGVGADSVYPRDEDYLAPVTAHYGYNNVAQYDPAATDNPSSLIDGCTFEKREKIVYIDELDPEDHVEIRPAENARHRNSNALDIPPPQETLSEDEIRDDIKAHPLRVVCAALGEDEHSVGLREIIDIRHGGIERFGIEVHYVGAPESVEKLVDAAIELDAEAILASTIISHDDIHYKNMKRLHSLVVEKGIRNKVTLVAGGTQVVPALAVENGMDAGFGRGCHGIDVATFLIKRRRELRKKN
jgi:D-ornithine 4,5-aminomutase subunit beta